MCVCVCVCACGGERKKYVYHVCGEYVYQVANTNHRMNDRYLYRASKIEQVETGYHITHQQTRPDQTLCKKPENVSEELSESSQD